MSRFSCKCRNINVLVDVEDNMDDVEEVLFPFEVMVWRKRLCLRRMDCVSVCKGSH